MLWFIFTIFLKDPLSGIIPRITLFLSVDALRIKEVESTVCVYFIEIYNKDTHNLSTAPCDTIKLR